jgi:hypothetical protein
MHVKFAAFVDILGFASLVEQLDASDFESLLESWQRDSWKFSAPEYALLNSYRRFGASFEEWHRGVALDKLRRGSKTGIHAFLFSDSCFVASDSAMDIIDFTGAMVRSMILQGVPVRAGLGAGTFATFEIATRRGGTDDLLVRCPFTGSSIVRAYRAESSGIRGLRGLIHPSFAMSLVGDQTKYLLPLQDKERSPSASHELNLFWTEWDETVSPDLNGYNQRLVEMEAAADAPFKAYYSDTRASFARMAAQCVADSSSSAD